MNAIDILLGAFVMVPMLLGLWRGMLWPIAVVVGLVGGLIVGVLVGPPLGASFFPDVGWAPMAAAGVVFVVVFGAVQAVRWGMRRLMKAVRLKWVDHLAGGVASAAAGGIAGAWLVTTVALFLPEKPEAYESSLLAGHAEQVACRTGMPCEDGSVSMRLGEDLELPGVQHILQRFSLIGGAEEGLPPPTPFTGENDSQEDEEPAPSEERDDS